MSDFIRFVENEGLTAATLNRPYEDLHDYVNSDTRKTLSSDFTRNEYAIVDIPFGLEKKQWVDIFSGMIARSGTKFATTPYGIYEVGENEPTFDFDFETRKVKGMGLHRGAENLIVDPIEIFTNIGSSGTAIKNQIGPEGIEDTAWLCEGYSSTSDDGTSIRMIRTGLVSDIYTADYYFKSLDGQPVEISFRHTAVDPQTKNFTISGSNWHRLSRTSDFPSTSVRNIFASVGGKPFIMAYGQVTRSEFSLPFTMSTSHTDEFSVDLEDTSWFTPEQGTFYLSFIDAHNITSVLAFDDHLMLENVSGSGSVVLSFNTSTSGTLYVDGEKLYDFDESHGLDIKSFSAVSPVDVSDGYCYIKRFDYFTFPLSAREVKYLHAKVDGFE